MTSVRLGCGVVCAALVFGCSSSSKRTSPNASGGAAGSGATAGAAGSGGTAGSGGSGGSAADAGSGGSAGSAGAAGSAACTQATPPPGTNAWPDSFRSFCSDGTKPVPCPATGADALQDGSLELHKPTYSATASPNVFKDDVTGLEWQKSYGMDVESGGAENYCPTWHGNEWRLPSYLELSSLNDYGHVDPALDESTFDVPKSALAQFWTSSQNAAQTLRWTIFAASGLPLGAGKLAKHHVRCVKGNLAGKAVKSDSCATVSDSRTGLMWTRVVPSKKYAWLEALAYCDTLVHAGLDDWRLPNLKELQTIVKTDATPYIDVVLFGATPSEAHWTSTVSMNKLNEVGTLNFGSGLVLGFDRASTQRVRCVRSLP